MLYQAKLGHYLLRTKAPPGTISGGAFVRGNVVVEVYHAKRYATRASVVCRRDCGGAAAVFSRRDILVAQV